MARKIKKYGKVINDNPAAMEIYTKQKDLYDQIVELEKQGEKPFHTYVEMEGMYSLGTVADPWAGQGSRGYGYKYPNQEIEAKERAERQTYYTKYIAPLKERINELWKEVWALDEPLCIAVCGYGIEEYYLRDDLTRAEKELAQQVAHVEKLRKKLADFKSGVTKA